MISKLRRSYLLTRNVKNDMLTSTYFVFFNERPGLNERPFWNIEKWMSGHSDNYGTSFIECWIFSLLTVKIYFVLFILSLKLTNLQIYTYNKKNSCDKILPC